MAVRILPDIKPGIGTGDTTGVVPYRPDIQEMCLLEYTYCIPRSLAVGASS